MNRLILFLLCLIILFFSCRNQSNDIREIFGSDQNEIRKNLNLVAVDPSFQFIEDISLEGRRFIFTNQKEAELTMPDFLRKIILLDSSKQHISVEDDYFKNPAENKYLVVSHEYKANLTIIFLQDDFENQRNRSTKISNSQADSVLKSWKVNRNPF